MSKHPVETWRQSLKLAGVALMIWVGIVFVALIVISFCFYIKIVQERNNRIEALSQMSERHDYQQFRSLKKPILQFTRRHNGDHGAWVSVYQLDEKSKQILLGGNVPIRDRKFMECVQPTIETSWKGWKLKLHYVEQEPYFKDHSDYKNYNSFLLYGSDHFLKDIENDYNWGQFKIIQGIDKLLGRGLQHYYWAVDARQKYLFSVYQIN